MPKSPAKIRIAGTGDIQSRIMLWKGKRVILDSDLAHFYGVTTAEVNRAVSRNPERFPPDFCKRLTSSETRRWIFQSGISTKTSLRGVRKPARIFTEQGVAMLSAVLHSKRAVLVSIAIVRAFVQLRELLASHTELAAKLAELERKVAGHDADILNLFEAIRQLLAPVGPEHGREIGFHTTIKKPSHR